MGARRSPAQDLAPEQRTEARAARERRRLHEAVDWLLASRVAQGFPAKVEDPIVLARIAAILLEQAREQRRYGAADD